MTIHMNVKLHCMLHSHTGSGGVRAHEKGKEQSQAALYITQWYRAQRIISALPTAARNPAKN
jgi:hypothetical protein